jgi:hypothetical protein
MKKIDLFDISAFTGVVLFTFGLFLVYKPLSWLFLGVFFVFVGVNGAKIIKKKR